VCLALGLAAAVPTDKDTLNILFSKFVKEHGKVYNTREEMIHRQKIFAENLQKIEQHNRAGASYKMGVNQFTDLTEEEFRSQFLGYRHVPLPQTAAPASPVRRNKALPDSVDWRDKDVITAVKNQGQCGSCWAFATTEMIESYAALAAGSLPVLSAQQVTACTPNPLACGGTGGCMGSIPQLGYTYIQLFGHATEEDYPYVSGSTMVTGDCLYDMSNTAPLVGITGYNTITNDQEATMTHLAEVGPLAVAVDASRWSGYRNGVFDGCAFDANIALNHAVQLVGYGTDAAEGDYWIVRNSWGASWGESGYIRLKRTADMECGTDSTPLDGTACVGGPGSDSQHVCGQCGVLFDVSYPLGAHMMNP